FREGQPIMTVGSPGGSMIISIVGNTVLNVLDHQMDMQAAIHAARYSCRNSNLNLEALFEQRSRLVKGLSERGWKIQTQTADNAVWGGAQGIRLMPDGTLEGGADARREGAVRGY
ncbi:MAG TPA: gamma-glutamyltransferase, partial [Gemmatales bacterium]|nr:gamma-glutamyltransferase [Gemmatales bacterium]